MGSAGWEEMLARQLDYAARPLTRLGLVLAPLDFAWDRLRLRLDGLGDNEFFWEPVAGCWSVRAGADGVFVADWVWPEPDPASFTNIAWRLSHVAFHLNLRANHRFGDGSLTPFNAPWPGTATDALRWLDDGFASYRTGVGRFSDDDLDAKPNLPAGWLDNEFPTAMNVQDITLELAHHGAEIALLRDLYRTRAQ
jgi:hypothetical protein